MIAFVISAGAGIAIGIASTYFIDYVIREDIKETVKKSLPFDCVYCTEASVTEICPLCKEYLDNV